MNKSFFYLLCCFFSVLTFPVKSNQVTLSDSQLQSFAADPYWHKLLRYKNNRHGVKSDITSPSYFLSKEGNENPEAELKQNLLLLFDDKHLDNDHPRCQFVERYSWLASKLHITPDLFNLEHCTSFNQWANLDQIKSASLVYASGYLANPASFFGHLLIKFNYKDNEFGGNKFLDHSINFGAKIPPEDGAFTYVYKGFFGGYSAEFKEDSFFRHHKIYAEQESRNLWEYELNLTEQQLHSLIKHTWELRRQQFDYLYLNDNCASRIAELISTVTDIPLTNENAIWVQPISVFNNLMTPEFHLVNRISKHPSRYELFIKQYQQLTSKEKSIAVSLFPNFDKENLRYNALSDIEKINIINTLSALADDKLQFDDNSHLLKQVLTKERFALPPGNNYQIEITEHPPHEGQLPSLLQYSIKQSDVYGLMTKIRFRPTYFDLLGVETGRLPNALLEMADTEISISEQGIRLEKFDLINILSLSPAQTDFSRSNDLTWRMRIGLESAPTNCYQCLIALTELGLGKSFKLNNTILFAINELRLQTNSSIYEPISSTLKFGLLHEFNPKWKTLLAYQKTWVGINDHYSDDDWQLNWQNRLGNSRHSDVRFNLSINNSETSISLSYSKYWQ